MKVRSIRGLYRIQVAIVLTGIIGVWVFGGNLFDPVPIDIQLHDTYYIFPKEIFFITIFIGLLATTYLVSAIYYKLNNRIVNGILTLVLIVVFVGLVIYLDWVVGVGNHLRFCIQEKRIVENPGRICYPDLA